MSFQRGLQSGALAALLIGTLLSPAQAAVAKRPLKEIDADLAVVDQKLSGTCYVNDLLDPKFRTSLAPKVAPLLKQRADLYTELVAGYPTYVSKLRFNRLKNSAEMAYFDQKEPTEAVPAVGANPDPSALELEKALYTWWNANGDADAQAKVLDSIDTVIKAQPRDDDIARSLKMMLDTNPATLEVGVRASDTLAKMKTPFALQYNAMPNKLGKPLLIAGATVDGKFFRSDKFKGKVILVDFWATWCPPCREEIPHTAKLYQDYHDKGLEIIGVSSDNDRQELMGFLKQHTEMPWPELFAGGEGWHPLTKKFGITGIPTMYLIDRQGILRTMEGRAQADELIPKLLDEAPPAPAEKKG